MGSDPRFCKRFVKMPTGPAGAPSYLWGAVPPGEGPAAAARAAGLQRVRELGGKLVETKSHAIGDLSEIGTVMRDPEGNGFCIQTPHTPLPHRYIGNVTFSCAEPVALGKFWAAALGWPDEPI